MMSSMVDPRSGGRPRLSSGLDMAGLGARLRLERLRRRLWLHSLFMRTGVGRGMLSEVERGSTVPTGLLLARIATGLLTVDGVEQVPGAGDSIYYAGDCHHAFAKAGQQPCVYYLAMELGRHRTSERPRPPRPHGRRRTR